jgi:hypothetical protein
MIRAGNDREGVAFHGQIDSFSLGVSHPAFHSHPYSAFTYTDDDDVMSILIGIFLLHTLHHKSSSTYLCTIPLFSFLFSGTKG